MRRIIQIAGISDQQEAEMLIACGVDWLGFPLRLPVHQEDVLEAEAARIIKSLRSPHSGVLITYLNQADEIVALYHNLNAQKVQIHGDIASAQLKAVKALDPSLFVIKSLIVRNNNHNELETEVYSLSLYVDAFITDTYDPETGACGATGKTHGLTKGAMFTEKAG